VGVWAGNNDNTSISKKVAGLEVAPLWNAFMKEALAIVPKEDFSKPIPPDTSSYPPIIRGERDLNNPHEILHYINKENPLELRTNSPSSDSQYELWEYPVRVWAINQGIQTSTSTNNNNSNSTNLIELDFSDIIFNDPINNQDDEVNTRRRR
jgi:membrane peptidoglycan carboxypeptidase